MENLSKWGVSSLGKGFFEFSFSCLEDVKRVRSVPSWNLNPGVLKLFAWTTNFSPSMQYHTSSQVWVRIYGLSQEYWRPKILFAIANVVGTPICTDSPTSKPMMDRTFSHFVKDLVDMDLSQKLRYKVLVEKKDFAFFLEFEYENLPEICSHCFKIGHHVDSCKLLIKSGDAIAVKNNNQEVRKEFTIIYDGRKKQGTLVSNPIVIKEGAAENLKEHLNGSVKNNQVTNEVETTNANKTAELVQSNRYEILAQKEMEKNAHKDAEL